MQIMWEVDHIKHTKYGGVVFAFTKIGTYAVAPPEEIYFLKSPNLLTEADPTKVVWSMYPTSDHGVEAVSGTSAGTSSYEPYMHTGPPTYPWRGSRQRHFLQAGVTTSAAPRAPSTEKCALASLRHSALVSHADVRPPMTSSLPQVPSAFPKSRTSYR